MRYALNHDDAVPKISGARVDLIYGDSLELAKYRRGEFRFSRLPLFNVMNNGQELYSAVPGFKFQLFLGRPIETRHVSSVPNGKDLLAL
jgi:hypothetical protein